MSERKKVIFLNKDSSHLVGFTKLLRLNNYELVEPSSYEETSDLINLGETHLMIYSDGDNPENREICRMIGDQYPRLPIIYVLANDSEMEEEVKENAHRKIVRPLSQKKKLLSLMVDLLEIGRWVNVSRPLPQDDLFDSIRLVDVIDETLSYFSDRLDFANLTWMTPSEFRRLAIVEGNWNRVEQVQKFGQPANLRSLIGTTESHLVQRLGQLGIPKEYFDQGPWSPIKGNGSAPDVIIPIYDPGRSQALGFLFFEQMNKQNLDLEVKQVEETLAFMSRHISFSIEHYRMEMESLKDDLTGLFNQRYLKQVMDNEVKSSKDQNKKFSVLFIDIDYFKLVNDSKGHWVGSQVLIELSRLLKDSIRARDYAFRYGGDEFVVILSDTDEKQGELVAERIRKKVEESTFVVEGEKLNITVSIGLASFPNHAKSRKELIQLADEAMYFGKNKSRNIVYIAS